LIMIFFGLINGWILFLYTWNPAGILFLSWLNCCF
jgi:hypothetical protein